MMRGSSNESIDRSGLGLGLGPHLVGKQIDMHGRRLEICEQLGEGGFSFVYLVRNHNNRILGNSSNDNNNNCGGNNNNNNNNIDATTEPGGHNHSVHQASSTSNNNNSAPQHSAQGGHKYSRRDVHNPSSPHGNQMVLKITSVHNAAQRQMAVKEAELLQTLSHPSIVQFYDHGFRESHHGANNSNNSNDEGAAVGGSFNGNGDRHSSGESRFDGNTTNNAPTPSSSSKLAQHLILMEYCEGGTAFDAIKRMRAQTPVPPSLAPSSLSSSGRSNDKGSGIRNNNNNNGCRFDLLSLVISFGQICNAVSYLHAQRPPIIHRDLKPVNFLVKNGAYKLCDFGSAVVGHTDLRTPESRRRAEEVVNRTTTQMFRAPEMVDLYMARRLTQSTDVWALGCCLYSLAFLRDCFEEGSNLAILSRKYRVPDDNPYGDGLRDLIDRMLASDYRERADMSEVIMCLSALYSNRPLPKRKHKAKPREEGKNGGEPRRVGAYRTDGQGIKSRSQKALQKKKAKKIPEAKKLNPNSAAAKRKKASEGKTNTAAAWGNGGSNGMASPPMSPPGPADVGGFQNFASFDHVFEGGAAANQFDSMPDLKPVPADDGAFSATFDERCKISGADFDFGSGRAEI